MATKTFFSVTFKQGGHVDMVMPLKIRADHNFNFLFTIMYGLTILRAVQQALLYILGILQGRTEKMKVMKNSFFCQFILQSRHHLELINSTQILVVLIWYSLLKLKMSQVDYSTLPKETIAKQMYHTTLKIFIAPYHCLNFDKNFV